MISFAGARRSPATAILRRLANATREERIAWWRGMKAAA